MRPTSARVREALFDLVGHDWTGRTWLDAFGGSGLTAFEAWSRGATVTVVEREPRLAAAIASAARGLGAHLVVRTADALTLRGESYDAVFADPPYATDPGPVIAALAPLARSVLVVEVDARRDALPVAAHLPLDRVRRYGDTALWVYR